MFFLPPVPQQLLFGIHAIRVEIPAPAIVEDTYDDVVSGAIERWQAIESGAADPGEPGTLFMPSERRLSGRKRWIAFGGRARGSLGGWHFG